MPARLRFWSGIGLPQRAAWLCPFSSLLVFAAAFLIAHGILVEVVLHQRLATDFTWHIDVATKFLDGNAPLPSHFLFHVLTAGLSELTGLQVARCAVLVVSGAIAASAMIVHQLYLNVAGSRPGSVWMGSGLTFFALTATAIYVPFFNDIYLGQSSPTVWHNPTNMLLKPFALLAAWQLERILCHAVSWRAATLLFASALLGTAAKPAFAIDLIPLLGALVCGLYLAPRISGWRPNWLRPDPLTAIVLSALLFLLSAAVLLQAVLIWTPRSGEGIIFAPLRFWATHSPSIPISILVALAFPAATTLLDLRHGTLRFGLPLAWAMVVTGMLVFALFAESGSRFSHGNFSWPYQVSLGVLFAFAARSYFTHWQSRRSDWAFAVVTILLLMHAASGLYYIYQILVLDSYR